jgi:hypothetical protein
LIVLYPKDIYLVYDENDESDFDKDLPVALPEEVSAETSAYNIIPPVADEQEYQTANTRRTIKTRKVERELKKL